MIVSLRLPRPSRPSTAPAYGESASMHALLSLPVIRKFIACGSATGNVSGGPVVGVTVAATTVSGVGAPATVDVVAVVGAGSA